MPEGTRYEDGPDDAYSIIQNLIDSEDHRWALLADARIKVIFDTKMKKTKGRVRLAEIRTLSDMQRFLTRKEVDEGYHYFVIIDKLVWEKCCSGQDKIRLLRHELCHTDVDFEAAKPFKLRGHELEDFYGEVEENRDDPRWADRLASDVVREYILLKSPQRELPMSRRDRPADAN